MGVQEFQLKQRTGRETQKELLTGMVKTCYKKADSKEDFFDMLKNSGLKTYERGGKVSGVVFEGSKHRFKGRGYEQKFIDRLDKSANRQSELREMRGNDKEETKEMKQDKSRDEELKEIRNSDNEKSEDLEVGD